MKVCELSFVDIGVHRKRLIAIPVLRWAGSSFNRNRFYQSRTSSVSSGHPDRISTMGGDFLDVILVREASKSTIVYNNTHYYTLGRPSYRVGLTQASRTSADNTASLASAEPQTDALSVSGS